MTQKLIYIEASPRKERSASIAVASAFLESYKLNNPDHIIETIDLWSTSLPDFNGSLIDAKYRIFAGQEHTEDEQSAWQQVVNEFGRFNSADKYVISTPMWNFGIPYKLKHYIDIISQPTLAFAVTPEGGYEGLVTGKPITLICARGGAYPEGTEAASMDYQKTYLKFLLGFIGFTDIRSIDVEPMLASQEEVEAVKANKIEFARKAAADF